MFSEVTLMRLHNHTEFYICLLPHAALQKGVYLLIHRSVKKKILKITVMENKDAKRPMSLSCQLEVLSLLVKHF